MKQGGLFLTQRHTDAKGKKQMITVQTVYSEKVIAAYVK
jgi:hypothetical protein